MLKAPMGSDELERLETLCDYEVMETPAEPAFERLVHLTSRVFGVPMAMISLLDQQRQWTKARVGVPVLDGRRDLSFCGHAILRNDVMVVLDASQDWRFSDNPLVTGAPQIRFYAGAPLTAPNGMRLGTLCIMDSQPRGDFDAVAQANLSDLACAVMDALESRRVNARLYETEEQLRSEQRLLTETFSALEEGVVVQDSNGQIISANSSAARVLGLSMDQLLGRTSFDPRWRAVREDGTPFPGEDHPVSIALRDGVAVSNVLMGVHHSDADMAWISINARPLFRQGEDKAYAAVGSFSDVTDQHNRQAQLEFKVYHDALTGLPNREAFLELLEQKRGSSFALGFLDLNDFKTVNDRLGHAAGDQLLKQIAQRLSMHLRSGDVLARLSGDEFALYLPEVRFEAQLLKVRSRIQSAFDSPFKLGDAGEVQITCGFGAAYYPLETRDYARLMGLADLRMYESKPVNPRTPPAAQP